MKITTLPVGPIEANCYILADDNKAAVIDPGGDSDTIIQALQGLEVVYILNTHGHHDHVLANNELAAFAKKPVYIHPDDTYMFEPSYSLLGLPAAEKDFDIADLVDGQKLDFASTTISVLHTPGHTKGSVSFLVDGNLFCGDLLFNQSVGRTDLDGGSPQEMVNSLKKVMQLLPETVVYPGHGPKTTIGDEINNNPFLLQLNL